MCDLSTEGFNMFNAKCTYCGHTWTLQEGSISESGCTQCVFCRREIPADDAHQFAKEDWL